MRLHCKFTEEFKVSKEYYFNEIRQFPIKL